MADVSIVIVAAEHRPFLDEALAAIRDLEGPSWDVTIVLDRAEASDDERVQVLASGSVGPAAKRDLGAGHARGDVLAFLDDDAYPSRGWLSAAWSRFQEDDSVWAVGGPGVTPPGVGFWEQASGWTYASWLVSGPTRHRYLPDGAREVQDYPSMNLLVRRHVFEDIRGFDSSFYPGEDTKLCLEVVRRGGRIVYEPAALVYHHRRPLWLGHFRQIAAYGRQRGYFARQFPETSRRPQYFAFSAWVMWLAATGIAAPWFGPARWLLFASLAVYAVAVAVSAAAAARASGSGTMGLVVGAAIVVTHVVYGVQFMLGLVDRRPPAPP